MPMFLSSCSWSIEGVARQEPKKEIWLRKKTFRPMKLSGGQMAAAEPKRSASSCFDIHFFEGKSSCFHTSDISCHWTTHVSLPIARSSPAYQLCILEENWSKLACMLLSHSLDLRIHVTDVGLLRIWSAFAHSFLEHLHNAFLQCFLSAFSALAYLLQSACSAIF